MLSYSVFLESFGNGYIIYQNLRGHSEMIEVGMRRGGGAKNGHPWGWVRGGG